VLGAATVAGHTEVVEVLVQGGANLQVRTDAWPVSSPARPFCSFVLAVCLFVAWFAWCLRLLRQSLSGARARACNRACACVCRRG
jgi:hypothetical protein